tara:strand:+ start:1055 stop:4678 length:3624 start_codon:yes stop_codon:yes gene_type:complete
MVINPKFLSSREEEETISTPTLGVNPKFISDKSVVGNITTLTPKKNLFQSTDLTNDAESVDPPEVDNAYSYAFKLGLLDTYRGAKQIAGVDEEQMKVNQQKLNELMQGKNGGWVTAAYFAGALLDPAGWLIPFGKAKTLYSMARTGMVSGAIAGATGYVDEESVIDSRGKQALLGAVGGGIISPAMGGLKNLGVKVTKKGTIIPLGKKLTKEEMIARGASTVQVQGASVTGKAVDGKIKTGGTRELLIQKDEEIAKEGKSIFDAVKDVFKKETKSTPFPYVKKVHDVPKPTSRPTKWFLSRLLQGYQKNYEKHIGKRLLKAAKTGEGGTAFAGGVMGFMGDYTDNDEKPALSTRFMQATLGAMLGYGGVKFLKSEKAKKLNLVKRTKVGEGKDQVEFVETYPELFARWFIDRAGLPKDYRLKEIEAQGLENSLASSMISLAKKAQQLTEDENKLLYNLLSGDASMDIAPQKIQRLARKARGKITKMTQKYIDLGLLNEQTAKRNINSYIMRIYKEASDKDLSKVKGPINFEFKKIGDELRGRGFFKEYTVKQYIDDLRFVKNTIDDVVDETHRGWELPPDVVFKNNKLYKVMDDGTEKLLKDNEKISLRWEYSKPERLWMGEVENAAITMEYTGLVMAKTIAKYQFFSDIASKYSIQSKGRTKEEMYKLAGKYLKIPDTKIEGTPHYKYGKLAGKYVPEEIWKDIVAMKKYNETSSKGFWGGYKKLNSLWKVSKTAWNPTVHVNNIFGNVILSDLADVPILPFRSQEGKIINPLYDSWKALRSNAGGVGSESDVVELAKRMGVLDADFVQQEIRNFKFDKLEDIYKTKAGEDEWSTSVGLATNIYRKVKKAIKNNEITGTLEDWYRLEDQVFRLNAFMHRIRLGDSYEDAALFARKQFIDYDIKAPAIDILRNSITPFIAFTYRMVPILAEAAIMRPTKYAKYAALGYGLTNLEEIIGGEEAKVERALLPDYEAGNIMDLPFMPKKTIRIPLKDENGRPKFLNISRLFPGGDVLSFEGKRGVPFLPEPLQPSFGIVGDAVQSMFGYDIFRGEPDIRRGDGGPLEETMEALDMFGRKLIPNFPYIPGAYSTAKLERAMKDVKSPYRVPETEIQALFNSFGIKLSNKSVQTLALSQRTQLEKDVRKKKIEINRLKNQYLGGAIDKDEYIKKVGKLMTNIKKLQIRYFKKLQGEDPYGFRWFDTFNKEDE